MHAVLARHDRIVARPGGAAASRRFEKPAPNLLWQMDFKGWLAMRQGGRCHPLTIIDDHSRYVPCLKACADQRHGTVQSHLQATFERHGLPEALFVDNGVPWGDASCLHWTRLRVWLTRLGVELIYARPYHPQSRGKNERFHRTLADEVFALRTFRRLDDVQRALDEWRSIYNFQRPNQAIGFAVPADRYRPSPRSMPSSIPAIEYPDSDIGRLVPASKAYVSFKGRLWKVPQAFCGETLAIRPLATDGQYGVCFAAHQVAVIDLTINQTVSNLPEQLSAISPG